MGAESREGGEESVRGLKVILVNALVSAGFALLAQMKLVVGEAAVWFRTGAGATGISGSLSFALLGAGHLVGLSVGMAMLAGLVIGWGFALPVLTSMSGITGSAEHIASTVFSSDVRFLGAGVIGVAAIWALLRIIGPVVGGITSALASSRAKRAGEKRPVVERDLPIGIVGLVSVATLVPIGWLLWSLIAGGALAGSAPVLIAGSLVFVVVAGLVIAAVAGYMAGLIGSSNSPLSGIGILSIVAASLLLVGLFGRDNPAETTQALIAYALIVTGIVFGVATISNDNLQDLKTGQLVGATPWKQQVALVFGVAFGSLVIPPIMDLLNTAFGFAGAANATANALPAPQAALISSLAKGVLGGDLNWAMIGTGGAIGVAVIIVDELLGIAGKLRLPPLAVGIGIYLPMSLTLPLTIGAVVGFGYDRWAARSSAPDFAKRMGVLTATGMIVGESLFGVGFAAIVAVTGTDSPLAVVGDGFAREALVGGTVLFFLLAGVLYRRTMNAVHG